MIPTLDNTNPQDPEEHALWALVGIGGDAPLLMPLPMMRQWSRHLYECGFRHHPELQEIAYLPPSDGESLMQSVAGRWVPIAEATAQGVDQVDEIIDGLPAEVIDRIVARRARGDV